MALFTGKPRDRKWQTIFTFFPFSFSVIIFLEQFIVDIGIRKIVIKAKLKDRCLKRFVNHHLVVHVMKEKLFEVPFDEPFEYFLVLWRYPKVAPDIFLVVVRQNKRDVPRPVRHERWNIRRPFFQKRLKKYPDDIAL